MYRCEQHRKSLSWQKRYLLLLLQGHRRKQSVAGQNTATNGQAHAGELSYFANFPRVKVKSAKTKFR